MSPLQGVPYHALSCRNDLWEMFTFQRRHFCGSAQIIIKKSSNKEFKI